MYEGEQSCRFLGGKLTYLKRSKCKTGHSNDQWRRVKRCVYEPPISGGDQFGKLQKMNKEMLKGHVEVLSKYKHVGAGNLLKDHGSYQDKKHNKGFVKFRGKSATSLSGLSVTPSADSKKNPNYFHVIIHYKNSKGHKKQYDIIKRPKKPMSSADSRYEYSLFSGHVEGVYGVDIFFENSNKKQGCKINRINFYQSTGKNSKVGPTPNEAAKKPAKKIHKVLNKPG